jgi:hypothetical protein
MSLTARKRAETFAAEHVKTADFQRKLAAAKKRIQQEIKGTTG